MPHEYEQSLYRQDASDGAALRSGTKNVSLLDQSITDPIPMVTQLQIPKIFIFNYRLDLLRSQHLSFRESKYFENVVNTVRMYTQAWKQKTGEEEFHVWFMDDDECARAIRLVEPELERPFQVEKDGSYKSDICRGAALYLTGGYYFDVDMLTISPVELSDNVTLSVVASDVGGYFNSYMVASPRNPVIRDYLQILLQFYRINHNPLQWLYYPFGNIMQKFFGVTIPQFNGEMEIFYQSIPSARRAIEIMMNGGLLGVRALEGAVKHHLQKNISIHVLRETDMSNREKQTRLYPNLQFQNDGEGGCCNYLVEDREANRAHFFARFVGAKHTCDHTNRSKRDGNPVPWWKRKAIVENLGVRVIKILSERPRKLQ